jgi:exopolysaccharide biosynthesis polyprenyl glycosylphosphotransferase
VLLGGPTDARASAGDAAHTTVGDPRGAVGMQRSAVLAALLRIAPGIAAGLAAALVDEHPAFGVLVGASIVVVSSTLESAGFPLHLMPIARVASRATAVAVGAGIAFAVSLIYSPGSGTAVLAALAAGWAVLAVIVGAWSAVEHRFPIRVAIIGSRDMAASLQGELKLAGITGYELVGRIEADERPWDRRVLALGTLANLEQVVDGAKIELLVEGGPSRGEPRDPDLMRHIAERVSACCLERRVAFIRANAFFEQLFAHVPLGRVDATWFEYVMHPGYRPGSRVAKRAIGAALSVIGSVLTAPVVAAAAVAIKLTDGGPVLYRQRRVGERGREFDLLKLRTMRVDAEGDGVAAWATAGGDSRATRVGAFLRRTHLDELPQLWQVVTGKMALVGPRPERPELVAQLERRLPFYGRRHLMRPGITGWAQVRCGYSGSVAGSLWKLSHDLYYLKHRSLFFDALILLETLATPIRDARLVSRVPDERFLLNAMREEDQAEPALDPGLRVTRRRFAKRRPTAVA